MFSWIRPLFVASLHRGILPAPMHVSAWPEKDIILGKKERISIDSQKCESLETLRLVCRLEKIPLVENDVTAHVSAQYMDHAPVDSESVHLYPWDEKSAHRSRIRKNHLLKGVTVTWVDFDDKDLKYRLENQSGAAVSRQDVLYTHMFRQQMTGHFAVHYRYASWTPTYVTPPGRDEGYPLWSYGGVLGESGQIHLSEAIFFSVNLAHDATYVDLIRSAVLREVGADYGKSAWHNERELVVQESGVSMETLADSVASGCIQIVVKQDHEPPIHMQSIRIKPETESQFVVTFKRKKAVKAV